MAWVYRAEGVRDLRQQQQQQQQHRMVRREGQGDDDEDSDCSSSLSFLSSIMGEGDSMSSGSGGAYFEGPDFLDHMDFMFQQAEEKLNTELVSILGGGEEDDINADIVENEISTKEVNNTTFSSDGFSRNEDASFVADGRAPATEHLPFLSAHTKEVRAAPSPVQTPSRSKKGPGKGKETLLVAGTAPLAREKQKEGTNITAKKRLSLKRFLPNPFRRFKKGRARKDCKQEKLIEKAVVEEDQPFDCESINGHADSVTEDSASLEIVLMEEEGSPDLASSPPPMITRKVTPEKADDNCKRRYGVDIHQSPPSAVATNTTSRSSPSSMPAKKSKHRKQPSREAFDRLISVLDRPFPYWKELDELFRCVFPWTLYQRGRMMHHLIHFLELKLGLDEYVPTGLILPTLVVDEAWRTLVMETTLYRKILNCLQDFHDKPRAMIHYSFVHCQGLSTKERLDKVRRTQSLFQVYFKEIMPSTIDDEPPSPTTSSSPRQEESPISVKNRFGATNVDKLAFIPFNKEGIVSKEGNDDDHYRPVTEAIKVETRCVAPPAMYALRPCERTYLSPPATIMPPLVPDFGNRDSPTPQAQGVEVSWNATLSPGSYFSSGAAAMGACGSEAPSTGADSDILLGLGMLEL